MATPATEEDTHPKVINHGEWCEVLDSCPKDASGQLERDQQPTNEVTKQLVVELHMAYQLKTSSSAKPKSADTKTDLIYKRAFYNYL